MSEAPDRNLALELVRVTEAAALASARWVGFGDKEAADQAAVDAMRHMLATVEMDGVVVIGEGEKDEAPMLFNGERIGTGSGVSVDVAVDPLEGTELVARGQPNALAVVAAAESGTMFDPGPVFYMEKLACGADVDEELDMHAPIEETLELVARARRGRVRDLMVVILDRPRHDEMVKRIRAAGARIRFIPHGDVAGAMMAASPETGIDLLWGIGGTPEGVISAAAIKCIGGQLLGKLWPRNDSERQAAIDGAGGTRRRLRPRPRAHDRRPDPRRERLLRRHRRDRRRPAPRRPLPRRRRPHLLARHALEVRHRPHAPGHALDGEAVSCGRRAVRIAGGRLPQKE
jgi:fructose-1,6-bisphosphatase II